MNRPDDFDRDAHFDAQARRLHQASLTQLTPGTLAQLRAARAETRTSSLARRWPWLAATAFSGLLAVAIGLQWMPDAGTGSSTPASMMATQSSTQNSGDSTAMLEENPDLYLWLASAEAQPLAME